MRSLVIRLMTSEGLCLGRLIEVGQRLLRPSIERVPSNRDLIPDAGLVWSFQRLAYFAELGKNFGFNIRHVSASHDFALQVVVTGSDLERFLGPRVADPLKGDSQALDRVAVAWVFVEGGSEIDGGLARLAGLHGQPTAQGIESWVVAWSVLDEPVGAIEVGAVDGNLDTNHASIGV